MILLLLFSREICCRSNLCNKNTSKGFDNICRFGKGGKERVCSDSATQLNQKPTRRVQSHTCQLFSLGLFIYVSIYKLEGAQSTLVAVSQAAGLIA